MKKILVALLLTSLITPVMAHGPGHYRGGPYYRGSGWGWVAPAIIGGAVVYAATRPVYAYPPPPLPVIVQNALPPAPLGYHYEMVLDAGCNCYRQVLLPN